MSSPPPLPLARRTAAGVVVVVDERPARVACRWTDLPSRDGERFEVEWTGHIACVDTPADRALLCERLMDAGDPTLAADRVVRMLVDEVRPALARWLAQRESAATLDGSGDAELASIIEADARRAGFAAGLRVAAPFALRVESPTVRRAQDAARARRHLDAIVGDRAAFDAAAGELRDAVAGDDRPRVARAAARIDPRDLLRAVAAADANWSAVAPLLYFVAGDSLVSIDPTRPDHVAINIKVEGIGPLRSVRDADIGGHTIVVGGRDGVAVVCRHDEGVIRTLRFPAAGDVGFNATCVLDGSRELLATHAAHGLVRWRLDDRSRLPVKVSIGPDARGARLLVAVADDLALLVDDRGTLLRVGPGDDAATPIGASASPIVALASLGDGRAVVADAERHVAVVHPRDPSGGPIALTRLAAGIESLAAIDLCGLPRVLIAHDDGAVVMFDPERGESTPIVGRWAARAIRARPGYAALLGVDRTRLGIVDLARPEAPVAEFHVHALLGRRAADLCFS